MEGPPPHDMADDTAGTLCTTSDGPGLLSDDISVDLSSTTRYVTDFSMQQQAKVMKALRKVLKSPGSRSWLNAEVKQKVSTALACQFKGAWKLWFEEKIDEVVLAAVSGITDKQTSAEPQPAMSKLNLVLQLLVATALSHFLDQLSLSLVCHGVREVIIPLRKGVNIDFSASSPAQNDAMCRILGLHDISIANDTNSFDCIRKHGHCENLAKVMRVCAERQEDKDAHRHTDLHFPRIHYC